MKVIKRKAPELECDGIGFQNQGCESLLELEPGDVYKSLRTSNTSQYYIVCIDCGARTEVSEKLKHLHIPNSIKINNMLYQCPKPQMSGEDIVSLLKKSDTDELVWKRSNFQDVMVPLQEMFNVENTTYHFYTRKRVSEAS